MPHSRPASRPDGPASINVVDQGVGQHLGALDDHLIGIDVTVVAGLGEDGDGLPGNGAAVLVSHNFAHHTAGGLGHRVQNGLGQTVTDGGMQALALYFNGFHHGAQAPEVIGFLTHQLGLDVLIDDGDKVFGQEQRVTSACAGVLHSGAVAISHLAVLQNQHDGNGLTRLADRAETCGDGGTHIEGTVMTGTLLDGALVVKVEAGTAGGADKINDFHIIRSP